MELEGLGVIVVMGVLLFTAAPACGQRQASTETVFW